MGRHDLCACAAIPTFLQGGFPHSPNLDRMPRSSSTDAKAVTLLTTLRALAWPPDFGYHHLATVLACKQERQFESSLRTLVDVRG